MAPEHSGKGEFGHPLGKGHDRGNGHAGRATDKDIDPKGEPAFQGLRMVHADTAMNLVMQTRLGIRTISAAGNP